jgi:membrane protein DedA with SNARE-associated domain
VRLEQLLIVYGPAAVVLGSMIEGDMTVILSGVVAHLGIFPLPVAMIAGAAGNFLGDCVWYWIGRHRGTVFRSSRLYQRVGARIEQLARRFGVWELLLVRFVYGTRNASMLFWGLHGLPFTRFVAIDALSCAMGAALFSTLGYLVSGSAELLLGKVRRVEFWLLGAVLVGIALVVLVHLTTKRRLHLDEDASGDR